MTTHDPTTLNRQGADYGTQYRSVIYYHDENQKAAAEEVLALINPSFDNKVVTELSSLGVFILQKSIIRTTTIKTAAQDIVMQ